MSVGYSSLRDKLEVQARSKKERKKEMKENEEKKRQVCLLVVA